MDVDTLREIASSVLVPLLPGSRITDVEPSTNANDVVANRGITKIGFKLKRTDRERLILFRSQPFDQTNAEYLNEYRIVKALVQVVSEMEVGLTSSYRADVMVGFERRIVAQALADGIEPRYKLLLDVLDHLQSWSLQSYEGGRISASIGVDWEATGRGPTMADMATEDFSKVTSNGFDTMLVIDNEANLVMLECLSDAGIPPQFSPYRTARLAEWATGDRIVLILNRLGEILIFARKRLLFCRRFGRWFFLTHETAIHQMRHPHSIVVRQEVLASARDASFARTGACIGVVSNGNRDQWQEYVDENDRIVTAESTKSRAIRVLVSGAKFHELDRRLRQELLAIDGATVIAHNGCVLAVGAILKVPAGSTGGGRKAAAIQLGKLGMGLKISQDGGISGFKGEGNPAFTVMG